MFDFKLLILIINYLLYYLSNLIIYKYNCYLQLLFITVIIIIYNFFSYIMLCNKIIR